MKTPRLLIAFILVLFPMLPVSVDARITNAQSTLFDVTDDGLYLNSELAYSRSTGTADVTQLSFAEGTHWLGEPHLFFFSASGAYANKDGERYTNRYYAHLRYRYRIWKMIMAEGFVQGEYNEFRRILTRLPVGAGPRIEQTIGNDRLFQFALGSSYMFEFVRLSEDYNDDGVPYADSHHVERNHRWNNYLAVKLNLPVMSIGSTLYVQPKFTDFADYSLLWESDVTFNITDHLSISLDYVAFHDSRPPISVVKGDSEFKTLLTMQLGPFGGNN